MLTPSKAVDLFLGDLTRRSRSKSGRTAGNYQRILDKFTDHLARRGELDVGDIDADDVRAFLNQYVKNAAGYQSNIYSTLNSFFRWLYLQRRVKRNPLDDIPRPLRIRAEDLDVTTVSTIEVPKLMGACRTDAERICIAILAYLGPRRNAVALLRRSDYDDKQGMIRFREKGSKVIRKPVPDELAHILDAAIARGVYADDAMTETKHHDPYLVPPEGPLLRKGDRDDRVIWRLVKKVADRAGVDCHVHALRAAFATYYLEAGGDIVGLQELMGHSSIETTRLYLRKLDKQRAMEPVRTLSWGAVGDDNMAEALFSQVAGKPFASLPVVGAGGFEPPNPESPHDDSAGSKPERVAPR
jgi:integrase